MTTYKFTQINNRQVQVDVANAFYRLDNAFRAAFPGLHLIVAEGTRSREKQAELYAAWIRHRDYGGPTAPLAAPPGQSNHDVSGPRGPRALDVWDSGTDPGVTKAGTKRANWLKANAPRFGFDPAGYGFVRIEPWHIEFTGALTNKASGKPAAAPQEADDMIINIKGKSGSRRGGLYYVSGGKATFIGARSPKAPGRYPMVSSEAEIKRLQSRISGLK